MGFNTKKIYCMVSRLEVVQELFALGAREGKCGCCIKICIAIYNNNIHLERVGHMSGSSVS